MIFDVTIGPKPTDDVADVVTPYLVGNVIHRDNTTNTWKLRVEAPNPQAAILFARQFLEKQHGPNPSS